jgi:hypothetical protein
MTRKKSPPEATTLLHPNEVAEKWLAVSRAQVYKLAVAGELTPVDIGAGGERMAMRITRQSVEDFLARREATTRARLGQAS